MNRSGLKTVILPKQNEADLEDIIQENIQNIEFEFVETMDDILQIAFQNKQGK